MALTMNPTISKIEWRNNTALMSAFAIQHIKFPGVITVNQNGIEITVRKWIPARDRIQANPNRAPTLQQRRIIAQANFKHSFGLPRYRFAIGQNFATPELSGNNRRGGAK